jgi:hypothetical protein
MASSALAYVYDLDMESANRDCELRMHEISQIGSKVSFSYIRYHPSLWGYRVVLLDCNILHRHHAIPAGVVLYCVRLMNFMCGG